MERIARIQIGKNYKNYADIIMSSDDSCVYIKNICVEREDIIEPLVLKIKTNCDFDISMDRFEGSKLEEEVIKKIIAKKFKIIKGNIYG